MTLINLGQNLIRLGNFEKGEQNILEGVSILHQIGDQGGVARGFFELARYYFWVGEFAKSCQYNEKSIPIFYKLGILDQYLFASIGLGLGLSHQGKYTEAIDRVRENLSFAKDLDSRREIGMAYVILGMAYLGQGEFEQAEKSAHISAKQYRNLNQQEELCLALAVLVYIKLALSEHQKAADYLQEILQIGLATKALFPILYILNAAALLLFERGIVDKAFEVSELVKNYPFVQKSRWFEDISGRKITALTESLPENVVRASQDCGCKRDIWETARKLLEELKDQIKHHIPA
jgi:tetratricopeptide (TPR) repeat protein